jgi:CcmD family protein
VTGGGAETDANAMLIAAYMAFWLLLFAFVASTWRTQRKLGERLDRLEKNLVHGGDSKQER